MKYKFYMQECDSKGTLLAGSTKKDLEVDFGSLRYSAMEGIETIGKPKNISTESYADSDRLRVYMPDEIVNEATKITFKCYFIGDTCMSDYYKFTEYIRNGFHRYWDNLRKKWFAFYCEEEIRVTSSKMYGTKYLEVTYTLNNIFGKTFDI